MARPVARAEPDVNPYAAPAPPSSRVDDVVQPDEGPIQFPAGRGARLLAQILDFLFALLWLAPGVVLLLVVPALVRDNRGIASVLMIVTLLAMLGGAIGLLIYQLRLLAREGQTWGKKQMNVRIVMYDTGEVPGLGRSFGLRIVVNALIGAIPLIGIAYRLIDPLLIFGEERRCLHDLLAGTKVVEAS